MIFVNFKTYDHGSGKGAIELAKIIDTVARDIGVGIFACPQAVDIREVLKAAKGRVWAQHVDEHDRGKTTGWFPAQIAKELGVRGTLLNHSEHKISLKVMDKTLQKCRQVNIKTIGIANSLDEAKKVAVLRPDYLGYEPPEFVGSTTNSVAMAKPEVIAAVVAEVRPLPVLVGAGVHSKQDVLTSLKLGAVGIILATDVVLAEDSKEQLTELARGFLT